MSTEALNQDNRTTDATTTAVYEVIKTMDGEHAGDSTSVNGAAAVTKPCPEVPAGRQPPERLNTDLEQRLVDMDVFGRRTMAQRRLLGCLGCKLGSQPGNTGTVGTKELAQCNSTTNTAVRRILERLVEGGFLKTEIHITGTVGRPPEQYRLTGRAVHYAFKRNLTAPDKCGLQDEKGARFNSAAEEILIAGKVFEGKGSTPRSVLGCLACRLQGGEMGLSLRELRRCTDTSTSHSQSVLQRMVDAGVLDTQVQIGPGGMRPVYKPADTDIANKIVGSLEVPARCGLEGRQR